MSFVTSPFTILVEAQKLEEAFEAGHDPELGETSFFLYGDAMRGFWNLRPVKTYQSCMSAVNMADEMATLTKKEVGKGSEAHLTWLYRQHAYARHLPALAEKARRWSDDGDKIMADAYFMLFKAKKSFAIFSKEVLRSEDRFNLYCEAQDAADEFFKYADRVPNYKIGKINDVYNDLSFISKQTEKICKCRINERLVGDLSKLERVPHPLKKRALQLVDLPQFNDSYKSP